MILLRDTFNQIHQEILTWEAAREEMWQEHGDMEDVEWLFWSDVFDSMMEYAVGWNKVLHR